MNRPAAPDWGDGAVFRYCPWCGERLKLGDKDA